MPTPATPPPVTAAPDTLTVADRQLVIDDRGAGVLARAILEQPTRHAAAAYVRAVLGKGVIAGATPDGQPLAVTVGDRSGVVWSEIADAVRYQQLALPFV